MSNFVQSGDNENDRAPEASTTPARLLELFRHAGRLKRVLRAGWVERGVTDPESVAEHSYRVALMALVMAPLVNLDGSKLIATALIHDLCEVLTGDLTPRTTADPHLKSRDEYQALQELLAGVAGSEQLLELWLDFEQERTAEGCFLKQLDKLEMAMQAEEYQRLGNVGLDEFIGYVEGKMVAPPLQKLFALVRTDFLANLQADPRTS